MKTESNTTHSFNDLNYWKRLAFLELVVETHGQLETDLLSKVLNVDARTAETIIENASRLETNQA